MTIDIQLFQELYAAGFAAIPIHWDVKNKDASKFPEHDPKKVDVTINYVEKLLQNGYGNSNAVAIKLFPPTGMLDFDSKNASNKNIYYEWFNIIANTNEDVLSKICIEKTRNNGHHVYLKYSKLTEKIALAREDGREVISLYTGALLSYCWPTPGYEIIHNDLLSTSELTDQEYDLLISTAAMFNEDKNFIPGSSTIQLIDYPPEYESTCLQFDTKITDDTFDILLNSIDLYRTDKFKRKYWTAYLRKGSLANYSAKVYFHSKRVLIFSASMKGFPNFHDCAHSGDNRWTLSPSKILFYKNNRSWADALKELHIIADSAGIDIIEPKLSSKQLEDKRMQFPFDVFPEPIQDYIFTQVIQHDYLAGATLAALSTCIGNSCTLEAMDGYNIKCILYMAIVAPPGGSKSPALSKVFKTIEGYDNKLYHEHAAKITEYKEQLQQYEKDKKSVQKPDRPNFPQTLIKDSTIETVMKILSHNEAGCCCLVDELSGFLARMNQYKDGDDVQKWLELWSGTPVLVQRIGRDENKVENPFCSIVGGIQPGVLETLSKEENQHNGFYHRFLFVYPEPWSKSSWQQIHTPMQVKIYFSGIFETLLNQRQNKTVYRLHPESDRLYKQWFDNKNHKYNRAMNDNIKGIIAKYQDYCLRFALILQVLYDFEYRSGIIEPVNMERAIRLTEYFFANMNKAMRMLSPETPVDKLQMPYNEIYKELPVIFTLKSVQPIHLKYKISDAAFRMFVNRNKFLFEKLERGTFEKCL